MSRVCFALSDANVAAEPMAVAGAALATTGFAAEAVKAATGTAATGADIEVGTDEALEVLADADTDTDAATVDAVEAELVALAAVVGNVCVCVYGCG